MVTLWKCPNCKRKFTRRNQRHACGTGTRAEVLRNRPAEVVKLYTALEEFAKSLGQVEFVTRERYVLLRTCRVFADAVVMSEALRLAIHLPRTEEHKLFVKVGVDRRHVTHVTKLRSLEELQAMKPFLRASEQIVREDKHMKKVILIALMGGWLGPCSHSALTLRFRSELEELE